VWFSTEFAVRIQKVEAAHF